MNTTPTPTRTVNRTPVQVVADRMAEFWDEHGIESYKASHRDGVVEAANALTRAGFELALDEDAAIEAADNAGYALGMYGFDWINDAAYHVVIAAILMGDGDV